MTLIIAICGGLIVLSALRYLWLRMARAWKRETQRVRRRELKRLRALQRGRRAQARLCGMEDVQ